MDEWTANEFEAHCSQIELQREQSKIQKDLLRNGLIEDELQSGFSKGFSKGMLDGLKGHSPLSHE